MDDCGNVLSPPRLLTHLNSMSRSSLVSLALVVLLGMPRPAAAQEWTRFRGPDGSGASETSFPGTWAVKDFAWMAELDGRGHSSPVVWGERIFLNGALADGATRSVVCLDARDGHLLWKKHFESSTSRIHAQNSHASSTPAVDESRVYSAWATPEALLVTALDHRGNQVWQRNLGPFTSQHGFGTSPIVYEDMLIIGNEQDGESSLVALDRKTGEVRWRTPRRTEGVAYSTPTVMRHAPGLPELIFQSEAHGITSIDPRSGSSNWELGVFKMRTVGSPLVVGNLIIGACGSGGGSRNYVVAVRTGEKPKLAYRLEKSMPYVPTPVARGDLVFLWGDAGVVTAIEAQTGSKVWQHRVGGNFSGSPVRAADKLYCISTEGDVVVLAASRSYAELGRVPLGETCRSTPAIAGKQLLLRTESRLFCLAAKDASH